MTALRVQLADAVTAELNSGGFSLAFGAERKRVPVVDPSSLRQAGLTVSVVPGSWRETTASRGAMQIEGRVDIGVQKKLDRCDAAEIDPLDALVEEIIAHLRGRRLPTFEAAIWSETANDLTYSVEHLDEQRCYTSVITVTYRILNIPTIQ